MDGARTRPKMARKIKQWGLWENNQKLHQKGQRTLQMKHGCWPMLPLEENMGNSALSHSVRVRRTIKSKFQGIHEVISITKNRKFGKFESRSEKESFRDVRHLSRWSKRVAKAQWKCGITASHSTANISIALWKTSSMAACRSARHISRAQTIIERTFPDLRRLGTHVFADFISFPRLCTGRTVQPYRYGAVSKYLRKFQIKSHNCLRDLVV